MSANTIDSEPDDSYILSRGFSANIRINLQHYLWHSNEHFLLHPCIPREKKDISVADIGSGTCIWMIEIARLLPPTSRLDAYDIYDCLSEPPQDIHEAYDIVHIQNLNSVVRENDATPIIRNMFKILKPGGFLTWGEYDFQAWKTEVDSPTSDYEDALDKMREHTATLGHTLKKPNFLQDPWTMKLPQSFANEGFTNIVSERHPFPADATTFLLDTFMVATYEISVNVLDQIGKELGNTSRDFLSRILKNRRNIKFGIDRLTAIGQKPI